MASRASGARFRQRKLSTKHPLQIVKEDEILDALGDENDPQRHIPRVETGVERAEEIEHHLQAVISASAAASLGGKVAQIFIPTPETKSSSVRYDQLYPKRFSQPQTYIRFSSTVEDCVGSPYCMTEVDDKFLQTLNQGKGQTNGNVPKDGEGKCTENIFEEVISFFEETSQTRQPFAAIDNPPVLSLDDMERSYDDTISDEARKWASDIYPHWQQLRLEKGNRPLLPFLKIETGQETDDSDAYVCFRRREVRQARKTRGRDAQVVEKLKKLRRELEDARQIVHAINQRERLNQDRFEAERKLFEQRSELKRVKIQQGIKGDKGDDEELLVNQRPAPKAKTKADTAQRPATLRLSTSRTDTRAPDNDLVQLADVQEEAVAVVQRAVDSKVGKHREWNRGFLDQTWNPVTPPLETSSMSAYLPKAEEYQLPTPPASVRSDSLGDGMKGVEMKDVEPPTPVSDEGKDMLSRTMFRFASPPPESTLQSGPAYRRRYGRNGRLYIEERWPRKLPVIATGGVVYDSEGESGDECELYPMDYYDTLSLNYRASLLSSRVRPEQVAEQGAARRSSSTGNDVSMANGQSTAGQAQHDKGTTNV